MACSSSKRSMHCHCDAPRQQPQRMAHDGGGDAQSMRCALSRCMCSRRAASHHGRLPLDVVCRGAQLPLEAEPVVHRLCLVSHPLRCLGRLARHIEPAVHRRCRAPQVVVHHCERRLHPAEVTGRRSGLARAPLALARYGCQLPLPQHCSSLSTRLVNNANKLHPTSSQLPCQRPLPCCRSRCRSFLCWRRPDTTVTFLSYDVTPSEAVAR